MQNETTSIDAETARQRALALANRTTFAIAMAIWVGMIVSYFAVGTGWRLLAGVMLMIPLIWHGTYLRFKRSESPTSTTGDAAGEWADETGASGGYPPDASGSSISLLLP